MVFPQEQVNLVNKGTLSTSFMDHMRNCDHKMVHEDFKFLTKN